MDVIKIIEVGLKTNGLHGLYVPSTCACLVGALSPSNCLSDQCEAGWKYTHSKSPEDWVVSQSTEVDDDDIEHILSQC